jgi:subtilase family serine protease
VKPVYTAGYNGANQSIAIVGQSLIYLSDIANFTTAAGITARTPILVLEPGSGAAAVSAGDEGESDLDVEYASSMAPGAQVYFVFTGNSSNYSVFNAIEYAITEKIAPIISSSYGACEIALGATNIATLDQYLAQGNAQGQTILSSAGDSGSTDCYGDYTTGSASNYQVAVDYPASSPYVTAMGGTEIPTAASASTNSTYFNPANGSDIITSLKSYVPEQVWNDDVAEVASAAPASGGGGVSIYELHPSWQTGTIGGVAIPSSSYRLLPDISLVASNYSAPLLFCTSDTSDWVSGQTHSCNSGFRDSSTNDVTAAGGTSFDGPIFAGLLALIEQKVNAATATSAGLGNINPTLYSLAANSVTYGNAFHDIATGGNQCLSGAAICGTSTATTSYAATTGYDQASGLGSIDLYNLLTAWPTTTASLLSETTTALTAATTAPLLNATDVVTITVAQYNPAGGASTTPTGTVSLLLDGASAGTVTLSGGVASYTFTATASGSHVLVANYSGDTTHAASTSSLVLTVGAPFTLSVPTVTITSLGGSANSTLTVTPIGGYTGTVNVTITSYSANLTNLCINDALNGVLKVTGSAAVTDAITVISNGTTCGANAFIKLGSGKMKLGSHAIATTHAPGAPATPWRKAPTAFAAFLLVLAIGGRRSRLLRGRLMRAGLALGFVAMLSAAGLGLSGCSNNAAASPTLTDTPAGTYTVTLTGTDSVNASLTTTTTFTIIVQ